jgi:hypothetical protein
MKMARIPRAGLFCLALSFLLIAAAHGQGDPYEAAMWDKAIQLPPGGYRAARPISLGGTFDIVTQPWTTIDDAAFVATTRGQHWRLNGTVMSRVSLTGQLSVKLDATNSVFENCSMTKNDGWWVDMWSTRWRFHNCIFAGSFMGHDLGVTDYSVHADHCTFYNVNLPVIGVKHDPGAYLRGPNMGFTNCLFVGCDVPESFLASTVNCVFENCHFITKRDKWPDPTTALNVTAYISGEGDLPDSFTNGPLSVQFAEAPLNADAGSTLPHSIDSDVVTLDQYSPPTDYVNLGSIDKRSSQLTPTAANTGDLPPAAAPNPANPANPGAAQPEIQSLDAVVANMPSNFNLILDSQPDQDGIKQANQWLRSNFWGRAAELPVQYAIGGPMDGAGFRVTGADRQLNCCGATLTAHVVCLFPAQSAHTPSQMQRGDQMSVGGAIQSVQILGNSDGLSLVLVIGNARLQ